MSTTAIIGASLLGSSGVAALITWLASRKTSEATASEVLLRTSLSMLEQLRADTASLRGEVLGLRLEVQAAQAKTDECHRDRDADRVRLVAVESELARAKAGPTATYTTTETVEMQLPEEGPT